MPSTTPPTNLKTTTTPGETLKAPFKRTASFTDSEESDPDFINGAPYKEEPKVKKRKIASKHLNKVQVGASSFYSLDNPLKEFLGSDLDVSSASEPENEGVDNADEEEEDEEEEEEEEYDSEVSSSPLRTRGTVKSRLIAPSKDPPVAVPSHRSPEKPGSTPTVQEDGSVTEPESDEEPHIRPGLIHKPPVSPTSRPKVQPLASDESETEPESDEEDLPFGNAVKADSCSVGFPRKRVNTHSTTGDDSATEPDSDEGLLYVSQEGSETANPNAPPLVLKQSRRPRPYFKSIASQPPTGPLVLDTSRGVQVNSAINRWLRDYQREGVQFFYERYKEGRGGILGDDMGLGKTIQVIAFLSAIMKKTGDNRDRNRRLEHVNKLQDSPEWHHSRKLPPPNAKWPTCLIVVPATVVHNWERELETWGYFEVGIYAGTPKQRAPVLRDFELGRLDIVITSFGLALKDIDLLESKAWSCIFVDEAHKVKNAASQTRIAFSRFDCVVRFGLTGTAIQNNYTEFWNILDWSSPGRLGTLSQWNAWVTKPLTTAQDSKANNDQLAQGRIVAERLVTRLLPHFFKRRTKDIIADQLPKKIDQVVFCPLTEMQKRVYRNFINTPQVQTMLKKDDPCDCGSGKLGKDCHYKLWDDSWVLSTVTVLIKISNHLALILPAPSDSPEQTQRHREQTNIMWPPGDGPAPSYGEAVFDSRLCGKWKVLKDLLTTWHREGKNKVLVFTKSVKLLEMLEHRLKEAFMEYRKLDGSVKQADRMHIVDQFNEDPDVFVFLISIMAGGVGLNLVAANKVVIFDPNWNPAHDLQAQDRAFRFGQRRDVSVYRFLGAGSLEELIYKRQIYKQQQMKIGYEASHQTRYFEGVQGDKSKQGELFGLKNILALDELGKATKHTIERSHLAQLDWALTNLEGKSANKGKSADEADMKGLEALFFGTGEDAFPRTQEEENDIHKILNSNGVNYTHHNDSLLKTSTIETKLTKKAIESKKMRAGELKKVKKGKTAKPAERNWPPQRHHHILQAPRKAPLENRMDALVTLGYIDSPNDLSRFAEEFVQKPEEEQALLLGKLDEETRQMGAMGDTRTFA